MLLIRKVLLLNNQPKLIHLAIKNAAPAANASQRRGRGALCIETQAVHHVTEAEGEVAPRRRVRADLRARLVALAHFEVLAAAASGSRA